MDKIYILGLAGSGKTYFAKNLSNELGCDLFTTDWILYKKEEDHTKVKLTKEEYLEKIDEIISQDSWIIEGVHYFDAIAKAANLIIFLDPPLLLTVFRIFKRFFTNKSYRKIYGIKDTLNLAKKQFTNYYSKPNKDLLNYPKYKNRKKYVELLKKYESKTKILRKRNISTTHLSSIKN